MSLLQSRPRAIADAATPEEVVIAWGDRVVPEAPTFSARRHTATAATGQVGLGVERVGTVSLGASKALAVASHGHGPEGLTLPDGYDARTRAAISIASHGLSVVTVRRSRRSGRWAVAEPTRASYNRRVHGGTVCKLTGPAAGDPRLRTAADPGGTHVRGTFGASAATLAPWGAVLLGEGRFADCFEASGPVEHALAPSFARYGLDGAGRGWSAAEERFDLAREPGEAFRFGWVVHLDPRRPTSRPRKLTMLGRLSVESIEASLDDRGRAVVRLRDAGLAGHSYVYVSRDAVDHGTGATAGRHNRRMFTTGTLHLVAPDDPDTWLPLVSDTTSHVPGLSVAGALLDTRLAAQRLLATL